MVNKIEKMDLFEQYANDLIEEHLIPGVGIAFNQNNKRIYEKAFGYRNVENLLPINADTVFGIASMTKSFTCVAIMQLQEAGKLSVHDEIVKYLPELKTKDEKKTKKITIHHLMTHTSGLPPIATHVYARKRSIDQDPSAKDYGLDLVNNPEAAIDTYEELISYISNQDFQLLGEPGMEFSYSNDCYGLLGIIINRVSGQTYEDYIIEHILQPIHMDNSFFDLSKIEEKDNVTSLYMSKHTSKRLEVYEAPLWWDAPSMRAAGYLKSTQNDILKYLNIFLNKGMAGDKRILQEHSVEQMIYPHVEFEKGRFYGYGLRVVPDYFGTTFINHGGGLKGVSSFMGILPEKGISGVLLSSLADVPSDKLFLGALNVLEGREPTAKHIQFTTKDLPLEKLQKYRGKFLSGEGMKVNVDIVDGSLAIISNAGNNPLRFIEGNLFIGTLEDQENPIEFLKDNNGEINRIFYSSRQIFKSYD